MARAVTIIPPTKHLHTNASISSSEKRRVCGYARVSTDSDEQLTSYDAQMEYYKRYISENENWEFIGLYSDEGRSGTSIKRRLGFQKMINDALSGKIDLIVTKSISRFARNTVDSISTVRKLKAKGVEVYFEKDGLWTFDPSAELTITILSSIAQEESRNLSQNVTWGQRIRFSEGKVNMPYKRFLGYEKGSNGEPIINEEQAEIVRKIYRMFVDGMTPASIAKSLMSQDIPTPGGKNLWQGSVVKSILTNEKYKGDALLQKTYCTDYLTKKIKQNNGEIPQYYVEGSHPAIINSDLFDHVQCEIDRRKGVKRVASAGCFAGYIICGECGSVYGSKVWHSNSKYRKTIWRCNAKYEKGKRCSTPHLYEEQLKDMFIKMMNSIISDKKSIISVLEETAAILTDSSTLAIERTSLTEECDIVMELMRKMVQENARVAKDQNDYRDKYEGLVSRYNKSNDKLMEAEKLMKTQNAKKLEIERFLRVLNKQNGLITEFDEELWNAVIQRLVVKSSELVTFEFRDGTNIDWEIV